MTNKSLFSLIAPLALILSVTFFPVSASAEGTKEEIAQLEKSLSEATNVTDSLEILANLFDATITNRKKDIGWQIIEISRRADNQEVLYEFLPQVAMINMRESDKLKKLKAICEEVKDPEDRKGINLFVDIMTVVNEATFMSEADRQQALVKYAQAEINDDADIYQQILDLTKLVTFAGMSSDGYLYLDYITRMERLIEQLPQSCYYIKNMFYTRAANILTLYGNHEKGLAADRKLLEIIDDLEDKYEKLGRKYRSYDRFRYQCYRRMLRNYEALSLDEVKELYTKCAMLAEKSNEVRKDFYQNGRPTIYRLMAEGNYKEAVPKIKYILSIEVNRGLRQEFQKMLVQAADSIGDNVTLLAALRDYSKMLQENLDQRSEETYREMQVRYDVNQLERENTRLSIEKKDMEVASVQRIVVIALLALLVLAVIIMVLYRKHYLLRQKTSAYKLEIDRLHSQMERILSGGVPQGTADVRELRGDHLLPPEKF